MPDRHLPVRPDLEQLKHQSKDLLRAIRRGEPSAIGELRRHHPEGREPGDARLADAQLVLARSYGLPSWPRLALACRMTDAIRRDDAESVRALVSKHPHLLHEDARGVPGNWGPPMSYAANLGRGRIVAMLRTGPRCGGSPNAAGPAPAANRQISDQEIRSAVLGIRQVS